MCDENVMPQYSIHGLLMLTGGLAVLFALIGNGFGAFELLLVAIAGVMLLVPELLRQTRMRFGIGFNYSCPICSGRVSDRQNRCNECGFRYRKID